MPNALSPKKLLHSKWTATHPSRKEKHFLVVEVEFDEQQNVVACLLEAVYSKRQTPIDWTELKQPEKWLRGWV